MSALELAVYAARLGDLLAEARVELADSDYADFLVVAAGAIARHVAGRLEDQWHTPSAGSS